MSAARVQGGLKITEPAAGQAVVVGEVSRVNLSGWRRPFFVGLQSGDDMAPWISQWPERHERRPGTSLDTKYPKTPYWPWSPSIGRDDCVHPDPGRFVGESVVVTEKLDGSNTLLHAGEVYGRSVTAPSEGKWMAMVRKHHAWKMSDPDVYLYGEDIYGVHSIAYEPVPEHETFYAFAIRNGHGASASFADVDAYARERKIPVVPILFEGRFGSISEIRAFVERAAAEPSLLGGEREGVILRLSRGYPASEFANNVCKSVRAGHVSTDEHWTRNWRPCRIARTAR